MSEFGWRGAAALLGALVVSGASAQASPPIIAQERPWRPAPPAIQIPLWPEGLSIARPATTGPEQVLDDGGVENVSRPTMSIYKAKGKNTGVAVVVFPGGGYVDLAIGLEGTEVCDWLTVRGITCVVLKYRVPGSGPYWDRTCNCRKIPAVPMALQDAQRTIGMLRREAPSFGINPHKVGVLGFSAGGHLVADVSNHDGRSYTPIDAADSESSRPDFAVMLYPGHLWGEWGPPELKLNPSIQVSRKTPPTIIIQAENDPVDDVRNSLTYYMALRQWKVPVEMHLYAEGGHAFGLRRTSQPITEWPDLVEKWLHTIKMLPIEP